MTARSQREDVSAAQARCGADAAFGPADITLPVRGRFVGKAPAFRAILRLEAGRNFAVAARIRRPAEVNRVAYNRGLAPTLADLRAPDKGRAVRRPSAELAGLGRGAMAERALEARPVRCRIEGEGG